MDAVLLIVHILITVALVGVILLQRSEGGALGMGGGGGGGLVSSRAVGDALSRATTILATAFIGTSILLALVLNAGDPEASVTDEINPSEIVATDPEGAPLPPEDEILPEDEAIFEPPLPEGDVEPVPTEPAPEDVEPALPD